MRSELCATTITHMRSSSVCAPLPAHSSPAAAHHRDSCLLVVGLGRRLYCSGMSASGRDPSYASVLGPQQPGQAPEHITSLAIAHHAARGLPPCTVLLGTSSGAIQLHELGGARLLRQRLHTTAVQDLRVWCGEAGEPGREC